MNINQACKILKLPIYFSPRQLKKAYYKEALATHPDVNKNDPESNEKFHKVSEAYQFLLKINKKNDASFTYFSKKKHKNNKDVLKNILKNLTGYDIDSKVLKNIIAVIAKKCINTWKKMLNTIDNETLSFLIKLISKHNDIFKIDASLVQELYHVARERINEHYYVLKPNLNHLLEQDFYILNHDNTTFYIPLWEHELVYKTKKGHIHVKCCPELPKHMNIDNNNVLHVNITVSNKVRTKKELSIPVGKSILTLPTEKIKTDNYTHTFSGVGIPNTSDFSCKHNILNSNRSDIKIHIQVK